MFIFNKKKAMHDFFNKNKAFLYWYLTKYSGIKEKHYYLLTQYLVDCMIQDIEFIVRLSDEEQRAWIINQVDDFAASDTSNTRRNAYEG